MVIREARRGRRRGSTSATYDRLESSPESFGPIALDESSILVLHREDNARAYQSVRRSPISVESATATPAPNDHMELGQHGEFLGIMPSNEMLMRWFISIKRRWGAIV